MEYAFRCWIHPYRPWRAWLDFPLDGEARDGLLELRILAPDSDGAEKLTGQTIRFGGKVHTIIGFGLVIMQWKDYRDALLSGSPLTLYVGYENEEWIEIPYPEVL